MSLIPFSCFSGWYYLKLHEVGTVKRLNAKHQTSNIERPILMALRWINLKSQT